MRALLGNHDLHLLAASQGLRRQSKRDTLAQVLDAPDRDALLDWLRQQPLVRLHTNAKSEQLLMVHAGVLPQLTVQDCLHLNREVQTVLQNADFARFLQNMYGNLPDRWSSDLQGDDRDRDHPGFHRRGRQGGWHRGCSGRIHGSDRRTDARGTAAGAQHAGRPEPA